MPFFLWRFEAGENEELKQSFLRRQKVFQMELNMKTPLIKIDLSEKDLLYLLLISQQGSVKKLEISHAFCH